MTYGLDAHIHTVASGHHTTDRLIDVVKEAATRGLFAVGISEHAAGMRNGCTESGFRSLLLSPKTRLGVRVLIGAEVNILDDAGRTDLSPALYKKLDYVIASLHKECFSPSEYVKNTKAVIAAMEKGACDVLGHPADGAFPLNIPLVVRAAKETGVLIEINEASVKENGYRGDNRAATLEFLRCCKTLSVPVVLGSDSHGRADVGNFSVSEALLRAVDFPAALVANDSAEKFLALLPRNKRS